tara:strand:- start:4433 stop:4768 length:336 start_codon:yes stop_codon:yes gene_type:complete
MIMGVRLEKPFRLLQAAAVKAVQAQMGVYQLADDNEQVLYIGSADARSLFGLRGELQRFLEDPEVTRFRVEVNTAYHTRRQELLMLHQADHGELPVRNRDYPFQLGRLSPA